MEYTLKRTSRTRSLRLHIESNGEVVVSAPTLVPKFMIERFVRDNQTWVKRHLYKAKLATDLFPSFNWEEKVVSYLGKLYRIVLAKNQERIKVGGTTLEISPITGREADAKKMLISWLERQGGQEINKRVVLWSEKIGTKYQGTRFRQQKSRWGSCTHDNHLSFNWRLIHFKPEVIDYVVIHELAHTKEHNHSAQFWDIVRKHDPSYKQKVSFLNKQRLTLL